MGDLFEDLPIADASGSVADLKRTCEECTRSKVKCSGPEGGICKRCAARGTECVFRTKMKRGPQTSSDRKPSTSQSHVSSVPKRAREVSEPDRAKDKVVSEHDDATEESSRMISGAKASGLTMSWLERRCWNVFFSTFKHQNRKENPISWCWFALQLDKLRRDLERINNQAALQRLESWMQRLHTKTSSLTAQTSQQCVFDPHLCAGCSAAALFAENGGESSYNKPADLLGNSIVFFQPDYKPFLEFEMDRQGARIVTVNSLFTDAFRHTKESLSETLGWSGGGGFLPWGGDLMSRLLWSEADVLIFLQVLAVKFQALGPPKHDHENPSHVSVREVLSAYIFDVRVANENNSFQELVRPCMIRSLHRETLQGTKLTITVLLEFDVLGEAKNGPETPESSKEALAALQKRETYGLPLSDQQQFDIPPVLQYLPRQESVTLPTPQEDLALLDPSWDWQTFETLNDEEIRKPSKVPRSSSLTYVDEVLETSFDANLPKSDEVWLASLLEWTD